MWVEAVNDEYRRNKGIEANDNRKFKVRETQVKLGNGYKK